MPLDPQLTIYNRVWAIIRASTAYQAIGVAPANEFDSTATGAALRDSSVRDTQKTDDASFPKVRIDVADESAGQRGYRSFNPDPSAADYGIPIRLNVDIKIVHKTLLLSAQTPLESAITSALLKAGPKLGLSWVTTSELQGVKRGDFKNDETGNQLRTVARIRLVVSARPLLSTL